MVSRNFFDYYFYLWNFEFMEGVYFFLRKENIAIILVLDPQLWSKHSKKSGN